MINFQGSNLSSDIDFYGSPQKTREKVTVTYLPQNIEMMRFYSFSINRGAYSKHVVVAN